MRIRQLGLWIALALGWVVVVVVLAACSGGESVSPCTANGGGASHSDSLVGSVSDEDLCPTERGEAPLGVPGFYPDGTMQRFIAPEPTPEMVEWSDWCFFDVAGAGESTVYDCATIYTSMAAALELLGMDPQCVLAQSTTRINALAQIDDRDPGQMIAQATRDHGWHLCPSDADPEPTADKSLADMCADAPQLAAWAEDRHGGCDQWAQKSQQLIEDLVVRPESYGCALTLAFLSSWSHVVNGEQRGYLWKC
ncbi:MAG: hypothetical protein OXH38_05150 [Chloroflexi bacterium]|nr:hypothetical protein [Chloroflexota bacterium]